MLAVSRSSRQINDEIFETRVTVGIPMATALRVSIGLIAIATQPVLSTASARTIRFDCDYGSGR